MFTALRINPKFIYTCLCNKFLLNERILNCISDGGFARMRLQMTVLAISMFWKEPRM